MKSISMSVLLTSALSLLPLHVNAVETAITSDIDQARSLVKVFGVDLKSVLKTAMKTEGPIKAIAACNTKAGPIAEKHSALSNWNIARTSMKVRNQKNVPDEWESTVLKQFEQRKAAGESVKSMEYSQTLKTGDKTVYRYMKAIPTTEVCLACHGGNLDEKIAKKVKYLYPKDQATGFNLGDIRGAFTLQKTSQ